MGDQQMDQDRLEKLGAIPMPQEGCYVVYPENVLAILTDALEHKATTSIVGKTSKNPNAAFIVQIVQGLSDQPQDFFAKLKGRAGLSQALMDL